MNQLYTMESTGYVHSKGRQYESFLIIRWKSRKDCDGELSHKRYYFISDKERTVVMGMISKARPAEALLKLMYRFPEGHIFEEHQIYTLLLKYFSADKEQQKADIETADWETIEDYLFDRYCVEGVDAKLSSLEEEHDKKVADRVTQNIVKNVTKQLMSAAYREMQDDINPFKNPVIRLKDALDIIERIN